MKVKPAQVATVKVKQVANLNGDSVEKRNQVAKKPKMQYMSKSCILVRNAVTYSDKKKADDNAVTFWMYLTPID